MGYRGLRAPRHRRPASRSATASSYTTFELGDADAVRGRRSRAGGHAHRVGAGHQHRVAPGGAEVVQCYVAPPRRGWRGRRKELKAFAKVRLDPGEIDDGRARARRPRRSPTGTRASPTGTSSRPQAAACRRAPAGERRAARLAGRPRHLPAADRPLVGRHRPHARRRGRPPRLTASPARPRPRRSGGTHSRDAHLRRQNEARRLPDGSSRGGPGDRGRGGGGGRREGLAAHERDQVGAGGNEPRQPPAPPGVGEGGRRRSWRWVGSTTTPVGPTTSATAATIWPRVWATPVPTLTVPTASCSASATRASATWRTSVTLRRGRYRAVDHERAAGRAAASQRASAMSGRWPSPATVNGRTTSARPPASRRATRRSTSTFERAYPPRAQAVALPARPAGGADAAVDARRRRDHQRGGSRTAASTASVAETLHAHQVGLGRRPVEPDAPGARQVEHGLGAAQQVGGVRPGRRVGQVGEDVGPRAPVDPDHAHPSLPEQADEVPADEPCGSGDDDHGLRLPTTTHAGRSPGSTV